MSRVTSLANRLIKGQSISLFIENFNRTLPDWILLLSKTILPGGIASSDHRITAAFRVIDSIICGHHGTYLLRRLAYVQLMRLFEFLEVVIEFERRKGLHRAIGYGNTSVAIDIYISAQDRELGRKSRNEVSQRHRRIGKRTLAIAGPSPLLLLMYSNAAESIMYVVYFYLPATTNLLRNNFELSSTTLCQVATRIQRHNSKHLVHICQQLSEIAESTAMGGEFVDIVPQIRQCLGLV